MINTIITVCTGNICRSPIAEYLFRVKFEAIGNWQGKIHSAGVNALVNEPADTTAISLMSNLGIAMDSHRSKQLTKQHLHQADLILVMEKFHRNKVIEIAPSSRGKTYLLGHWVNTEIPDPFQQIEKKYAETLMLIDFCMQQWIEKIDI